MKAMKDIGRAGDTAIRQTYRITGLFLEKIFKLMSVVW